jgi:CRISPR/Cas system-associated exonuclease Cas4 (RecB family)
MDESVDIEYLARQYPHERDNHILFEESTHTYTIDGDSDYTSVTTWVKHHFPKFDSKEIISGMMKSPNWSKSKYYGMTDREIEASWNKNRDESAAAGTKLHYDIECFYNNCPNKNDTTEYAYFTEFASAFQDLVPFRTEWTIYDKNLKLAGSIDMVFRNSNGEYEIYDWKRSKQITKVNNWNKYAINSIINYFPDTNYWHYCLQLNTYKALLEENYGISIAAMYLVCLHPNNRNTSFYRIKVVDLQEEISKLFNERKHFI